jgi:hypothetical protein
MTKEKDRYVIPDGEPLAAPGIHQELTNAHRVGRIRP